MNAYEQENWDLFTRPAFLLIDDGEVHLPWIGKPETHYKSVLRCSKEKIGSQSMVWKAARKSRLLLCRRCVQIARDDQ